MEPVKLDKEYGRWIAELAQRYRSSQIKAAVKVNDEMLRFYWSVGEDIEKRQYENRYGSHFYENRQHLADDSAAPNRQGVIDDFDCIFRIPWSQHILIIDKFKKEPDKALFFVQKTIENNWGYAVLLNFIDSDLYERQGAAQTNFALTIPEPESDLARELLKSPYDFTFLPGKERYREAELKDALIEHITRFLVELGKGFSYVGKEYRLVAGGKEKFIDLLFYIIPLHRYCVIEVKVTEFDFPDLGQLAGYVAMVDDLPSPEEIERGLMDK